MAQHNELGKQGEDEAVRYLTKKGYKILVRNWRFDQHEIDIIAEDEEYLVFVEVKTRASDQWGNPEDAVTKARMRRMISAADYYIQEWDAEKPARFDIIAIIKQGNKFVIDHIDDAFLPFL